MLYASPGGNLPNRSRSREGSPGGGCRKKSCIYKAHFSSWFLNSFDDAAPPNCHPMERSGTSGTFVRATTPLRQHTRPYRRTYVRDGLRLRVPKGNAA